jgi:Aminoglycoside-2''-adenylyltransferase
MPGAVGTFGEVAKTHYLLKRLGGSYWIAGGWAVDLFLGRQTRAHDDIEVAIARDDQQRLWRLGGIERIDFLEDGSTKPWQGQRLSLPIHQLQCSFATGATLEVLLNEFDGDDWLYRREPRVRRSRDVLMSHSGGHLPVEIVLLFKSKALRQKDQLDFENTRSATNETQKAWLREALLKIAPSHPWLESL